MQNLWRWRRETTECVYETDLKNEKSLRVCEPGYRPITKFKPLYIQDIFNFNLSNKNYFQFTTFLKVIFILSIFKINIQVTRRSNKNKLFFYKNNIKDNILGVK